MALTVEEVEAILRLKDQMTPQLKKAEGGLESFGRTARGIGLGLTAGVTVPIIGIGGAAIKMAMEAVESENLFEVSFEGMADSARKWSEELNERLGLNQYELRRTSATLFTMFDSMGLGEKAAFSMSTGITELAADMASFYNLPTEDAFEKLRAGIVGESEPLKRLGILVDETTVKQTAMTHGLIDQGEKMTQQQKVLARFIAITEQTGKAQGDLARTMDSPVNQLRIMKDQVKENAINLGMALLPAFTSILSIVRDLTPRVEALVDWFTGLSGSTQKVVIGIFAVAAALGPALVLIGQGAIGVAVLKAAFLAMAPAGVAAGAASTTAGAGAAVAGNASAAAAVKVTLLGRAFTLLGPAIAIAAGAWTGWQLGEKLRDIEQGEGIISKMQNTVTRWTGSLFGADKATIEATLSAEQHRRQLKAFGVDADKATNQTSDLTVEFDNLTTQLGENINIEQLLREEFNKLSEAAAGEREVITGLTDDFTSQAAVVQVLRTNLHELIKTQGLASNGLQLLRMDIIGTSGDFLNVLTPAVQTVRGNMTGFVDSQKAETLPVFDNLKRTIGEAGGKLLDLGKSFFDLNTLMSSAMTAAFGPGGLITGLFQKGMQALADLAWKGLKKIGGWFKDLFGGPSAEELGGREVREEFNKTLDAMYAGMEGLEPATERWQKQNILLREAYIALGYSAEEAISMTSKKLDELWRAEKQGPEATQRVADDILRILEALNQVGQSTIETFERIPTRVEVEVVETWRQRVEQGTGAGVDIPTFQTGGVMPHTGFAYLHKGEQVIPASGKMAGQAGEHGEGFNHTLAALLGIRDDLRRYLPAAVRIAVKDAIQRA